MGLLTVTSHSFHSQVFVITGSSRGIGRELARQVLEAGGQVVLNGRTPETLKSAHDELASVFDGQSIRSFAGDIAEPEQAQNLIEYTLKEYGRIDVLVNNAALAHHGNIGDGDPDVFIKVMDVNTYGVLLPTWYAIPHLAEREGHIFIVSSLAGLHGLPSYAAYTSSKMALTSLAESLQVELRDTRITVGIAYVGFTENEATKKRLRADGQLEPVPRREGFLMTPREKTARRILHQISKRKFKAIHSKLGVVLYTLNRISPGLVNFAIARLRIMG